MGAIVSDGTLPTFEEIVEARCVLTKIIEGIENGVYGVLGSEDIPPLLQVVKDGDD